MRAYKQRVIPTRIVGNEEGMCVPRGVAVLGNWMSMYFKTVKEKARIGMLNKA